MADRNEKRRPLYMGVVPPSSTFARNVFLDDGTDLQTYLENLQPGGSAQADWTEQNPSADSFIKNKPFDVSSSNIISASGNMMFIGTELIPNHIVYVSSALLYDGVVIEGNTLSITLEGITYHDDLSLYEGLLVSDNYIAFMGGTVPDLPFMFAVYDDGAKAFTVGVCNDNLPSDDPTRVLTFTNFTLTSLSLLQANHLMIGEYLFNNEGTLSISPLRKDNISTSGNTKYVIPSFFKLAQILYTKNVSGTDMTVFIPLILIPRGTTIVSQDSDNALELVYEPEIPDDESRSWGLKCTRVKINNTWYNATASDTVTYDLIELR